MGTAHALGEALGRLARAQTKAEARQAIAERPVLLSGVMIPFARDMLSQAQQFDDEQTITIVAPVLALLEAIQARGLEPALNARFNESHP